jgi:hypothetical protein
MTIRFVPRISQSSGNKSSNRRNYGDLIPRSQSSLSSMGRCDRYCIIRCSTQHSICCWSRNPHSITSHAKNTHWPHVPRPTQPQPNSSVNSLRLWLHYHCQSCFKLTPYQYPLHQRLYDGGGSGNRYISRPCEVRLATTHLLLPIGNADFLTQPTASR